MTVENLNTSLLDKVKNRFLTAWQEGHGGSSEKIYLTAGEDGIVLMIPQALYQAEVELHRTASGGSKVLNQYLRTLLNAVAEEFISEVEEIVDQKIEDVIPLFDIRAGWAIIFYRTK